MGFLGYSEQRFSNDFAFKNPEQKVSQYRTKIVFRSNQNVLKIYYYMHIIMIMFGL